MVDTESDNKTKESNVNQQTTVNAQTTAHAVPGDQPLLQHLNHINQQPPSNSQIPGQFNYFHQQYRQLPEDFIENNVSPATPSNPQSQLAAVYKTTVPTLSLDSGSDSDAKNKYALAKLNGNGSCSSECSEKFPSNSNHIKADFEQAIELAGYGKFHVGFDF